MFEGASTPLIYHIGPILWPHVSHYASDIDHLYPIRGATIIPHPRYEVPPVFGFKCTKRDINEKNRKVISPCKSYGILILFVSHNFTWYFINRVQSIGRYQWLARGGTNSELNVCRSSVALSFIFNARMNYSRWINNFCLYL